MIVGMTKAQFKERWDSDDNGEGITFGDIAECAVEWGLYRRPKICPMQEVTDCVLKEAGVALIERDGGQ